MTSPESSCIGEHLDPDRLPLLDTDRHQGFVYVELRKEVVAEVPNIGDDGQADPGTLYSGFM